MLKIENIAHSYDGEPALNDVSFVVSKGEIFGLIGPDGAGKTTLFRILTTLILPDEGRAEFDGRDIVDDYAYVRQNIGYMPGKFSLYQDLTVRENLEFFAHVMRANIEENRYLIDDIYKQLEPFEKRRAGALSGGMKQKLALCCALIHKPKALLLDEPTTGVDAVSRIEFWDMLSNLKEQGLAILVSTPYMDESGRCDRVALIQDGSVMKIDTPKGIVSNFDKKVYRIMGDRLYDLLLLMRTKKQGLKAYPFGDSIHAYSESNEDLLPFFHEIGTDFKAEVEVVEANIEDVFMNLMVGQEA